ncbi:hypothetical protein EHI8A_004250 [Entamoeba histolytica HM-1:IMSS-B]|nr:Hypothetical protein EHI5A_017620 [Entamoeba histolytica KU27]EMH72069.1 hypothetical protein EHI8A_004250 [Entamoeba histolytica HM-1:IMSS-B]EMS16014.1 hypothetical protein KM1_017900 [Entamoeba histolytica HM-3:IMSS]GAT91942.1 hypothetical protein CL6EHI_012550 [Entamoeba histolytica]
MLLIFLCFILSNALKCSQLKMNKVYSVEDAFECINSAKTNPLFNTKVVEEIKKELEGYVYKDILKNPPQPSFDANYHKSLDLDQELASIDVNSTESYNFFRSLTSVVYNAHDLHFSLTAQSDYDGNNFLVDSFYFILPFDIVILNDKSVKFVLKSTSYNVTIPDAVKNNQDTPVSKINGKSVLEFIRVFGEEHGRMKSLHGNFVRALNSITFSSLNSMTLSKEELSTVLSIEWSNGETCDVSYQMLYIPFYSLSKKAQSIVNRKLNGNDYSPLTLEDIEERHIKREEKTPYDLQSRDGMYSCKVDHDQKMNIFVLKSFSFSDEDRENSTKTLAECIHLFDENEFPISVILVKNGGGYVDLGMDLAKILSPTISSTIISSFRISEPSKQVYEAEYYEYMNDTTTCKPRYDPVTNKYNGDWYSHPDTVYYGDVKHVKTQASYMPASVMVDASFIHHPRQPTDIVVFTDGYCYSTCSMFTKTLKEQGGAIIVGFSGDPEGDLDHFDVGQSPSSVVEGTELNTTEALELRTMGIRLRFSYCETYKLNYQFNETIPREFIVDPVDERVNIYQFNDNKLNEFIQEAQKIINKYKEECNSKNDRLVLLSQECDNKSTIEHGHGGFKCGNDNKWTKECVISYCDEGYKFDRINQKCIIDVCYTPDNSQSSTSDSNDKIKDDDIIFIVVGSIIAICVIVTLIVLVIGLVVFCVKKKHNKSSYNTLPDTN